MRRRFFGFLTMLVLCLPVYAEDSGQRLIDYAMQFLGVPYRAAGTTRDGMDCSGFLFTAVRDAVHIQVPRTAADIFDFSERIEDNARKGGDLVFFKTGGRITHVGIYLDDGNFIHAASSGPKTGVIISNLSESYWKRTYAGAGRIFRTETEIGTTIDEPTLESLIDMLQ